MKMSCVVLAAICALFAAHSVHASTCYYGTLAGSFCCDDKRCEDLLGSREFVCGSNYQCVKCGSGPSAPACRSPPPPTYNPSGTHSPRPTQTPSRAPTYAPTYSPTYAPACNVKPVGGFCCSDADCTAQTGSKLVYCNTRMNQCNACGLMKTPKCPNGRTPVDGACPYAGFNNDGTFCCADSDCRSALNSTYVYCNKDFFQCNACGLPGTPACPGAPAPSVPGYGSGSRPGAYGYGGYSYGCSESVHQCCSDLTCQRRINNPYVFCNTTYYQCNACGNMANQACCPGNICRSGFTCTRGVCIQTGYVPPAGAVVGIVVGCAVAAVAVVAGVAIAIRRRRAAALSDNQE